MGSVALPDGEGIRKMNTNGIVIIITFLLAHWYLSAFAQSFFQHRYMAHKMFTMPTFWERFFYVFTWFSQGSSFLHPRAYALLHLEHHTHSDTEHDPHSPHFFHDVISMMLNTAHIYREIASGERVISKKFAESCMDMPRFDRFATSWLTRLTFCVGYTAFYVVFAPSIWWCLLLPLHFLMGPVHGAFVNWCGHKYGYKNYDNGDHSCNTFFWDVLFMGECFQNNHHRYPRSANFAKRWFEFDILYPLILLFDRVGIIHLQRSEGSSR